jgi:hypothetical protein
MTTLHRFMPPWDDLAPGMLAEASALGRVARGYGIALPLKIGSLPPAKDPRLGYLVSDNLRGPIQAAAGLQLPKPSAAPNVTCEDCGWRGTVAEYSRHRASAHAPKPREVSQPRRVSPKRAARIKVIEPEAIMPAATAVRAPTAPELNEWRSCSDCVWEGPRSEFREHREMAHRR